MQMLHRAVAPAPGAGSTRAAMRDLRWPTWLPISLTALLLLAAVLLPDLVRAAALPLAVTGALVGIPHGAVDHMVPRWWSAVGAEDDRRSRPTGRPLTFFVMAYVALAAVALAASWALPTATLLVFLALSALHFGRGEVVTAAERAGRPVPTTTADWPVSLAHGSAVVGLLFWAHPETTDPYLRPLSTPLADLAAGMRAPGLLLVALAVAMGAVALLRAGRSLELAELVLLTATFAVAPLAAFGVYFGGWHALRHTARLLDLARGTLPDHAYGRAAGSEWGPAAARLTRSAALPTLAALAAIGALWAARDLASIQAEVVVLLALTFPHAAIVYALDRRSAGASRVIAGQRR